MIQTIELSCAAHFSDQRTISSKDFLGLLDVGNFRTMSSDNPGGAACVVLFTGHFQKFGRDSYAANSFDTFLQDGFEKVANWLSRQPVRVFETCIANGLQLRIYINLWIDQNQLDLVLPPTFLRLCGERQFTVHVITNE